MDKHFHLPPRHSGYRMFLSGHKLQADTMFVILLFKFNYFFKKNQFHEASVLLPKMRS